VGTVILIAALATGQGAGDGEGRARRAEENALKWQRDVVLQRTEREADGIIRRHGAVAVKALLRLKPDLARELAKLHNSGELDALADPEAALAAIRDNSDHSAAVALFVIVNRRKLADPDAMAAFLLSPVEFANGLADLDRRAAEVRAARAARLASGGPERPEGAPPARGRFFDKQENQLAAALLLGTVLLAWAFRRRGQGGGGP
jgi:hypothetical protein